MIGKLTGRIDYRAKDHVLINVRDVGYVVFCSERTLSALPPSGETATLHTEMVVREDLVQLFGFASAAERAWHRLLVSVQGVGAKGSLAILGALGPDGLSRAILLGDWATVRAAKGIGPKIAQRIVLDLKDQAPNIMALGSEPSTIPAEPGEAPSEVSDSATKAQADALSALKNLGYTPSDAATAVANAVANAPQASESELIRAALRLLAPKDRKAE